MNTINRMARNASPAVEPAPWSSAWKTAFRRRLLRWFSANARELPWRENRDPYRVWLSEIMLQQTQVATVRPYFLRFVETFPTIAALAAADEQLVLRLWEGLGYYRRARQLHAAARKIVAEHAGVFPDRPERVRQLPGIGRYTAGAILSIAFDQPEPIVEANTQRLLARLLPYEGDLSTTAAQAALWQAAADLVPRRGAGQFNQAMMELGSLVCVPKVPRCGECPVAELCPALRLGIEQRVPLPKAKPKCEEVREAAVAVWRGGRVLLLQRQPGERWAGLWDFPRFELPAIAAKNDLAAQVERLTGLVIEPGDQVTTLRHGVTRFRITLECHEARYVRRNRRTQTPAQWASPAAIEELPCHVTGRKFARLLAERLAN
jgi:A/G-specific adenine glycosylase